MKMIFTDGDHYMSKTRIFESPSVPSANKLCQNSEYIQKHIGFGVAITPSSCYVLSLMEKEERLRILKHLYSKDGLNLTVGRLCIGSSDYSPEIYTYDDIEDDISLGHFSVERDEQYVIPIIKEILEINPALYLFASPWSPPAWMKTGENICGGYMREEYVECYAEYIVKFIKAYASYGIKISAITPQNECNTQQNFNMPSCIWHPEIEAKFICALKEKLKHNSLDVKIWMFDHNFNDVNRVEWSLENCAGLKEACDGVAFHYYSGAVEQTIPLKKAYPELKFHFTEGGPRLNDNYDTDWCKWGLMIIKTLKAGYSSFTGWNLMLDERGGPNVGPFMGICGGLVTRDSRDGQISYSGQYKAFMHIAPYVTPDSKIYPLSIGTALNCKMSAYPSYTRDIEGIVIENGSQKIAVVINPNDKRIQTQIELCGKLYYAELSQKSINTIIMD